jgi:hypothetical protein
MTSTTTLKDPYPRQNHRCKGYGSINIVQHVIDLEDSSLPVYSKIQNTSRVKKSILLLALLSVGTLLSALLFRNSQGHGTHFPIVSSTAQLLQESANNDVDESPTEAPTFNHYYFAYGALCNPISVQRRNVTAVASRPAVLSNFEIDFSHVGFGNILPKTDGAVHGVLMELTSKVMWERVVDSEVGYKNEEVWVIPYGEDEDPTLAHVFYIIEDNTTTKNNAMPQERYLKIIAQGMEYHGIDADYIQQKIISVECIRARKPEEYRSLPSDPEPLPTITFEEYQKRAKNQTPCFLMHDRVVDFVCDDFPDRSQPLMERLYAVAFGKEDYTNLLAEGLYDPDMPDFEQWKWAEDQFTDFIAAIDVGDCFRVTMRLTNE